MCKLLLLVISFFIINYSYAQEFKFDSGSFKLPVDKDLMDRVVLSRDFAGVNNSDASLKLTGNGAYIVFPNVKNLKQISFDYLHHFLSDGKANLRVTYRKPGQNFVEFPDDGRILVTRVSGHYVHPVFSQHFVAANLEDVYDIKFSLETTSSSALYLDNLNLISFSEKELSDKKAEKEYTARMEVLSSGFYNLNQVKEFNAKILVVKGQFGDNIHGLRDLCYRSRVLAALSGIVGYVSDRTKMGDVSNYSTFREKIEFVKENANDIQKKFLDQLVMDAKPRKFDTVSAPAKQSGLMKFIKVAGDLGNIITGGQLKSVVNSVQGLVSNLFDPAYLMAKTPEIITSINKGKIVGTLNPGFSLDTIKKKVQQGIELQQFFFGFFDIIDGDTKRFNKIVADFKDYTENAQSFVDDVEKLRQDYFTQARFDQSESFYLNNFLDGTDTLGPKMRAFQEVAGRPFDSMLIPVVGKYPKDREVKLDDLEKAIEINKRYKAMYAEYEKYVLQLRRLFSNLNYDLYQANPFTKLDTDGKTLIKDESFGISYEEYEALRERARLSFGDYYKKCVSYKLLNFKLTIWTKNNSILKPLRSMRLTD